MPCFLAALESIPSTIPKAAAPPNAQAGDPQKLIPVDIPPKFLAAEAFIKAISCSFAAYTASRDLALAFVQK